MTNCLKISILPSNWSTLLTTSRSKFVDNDFNSTKLIEPSWFNDSTFPDPFTSHNDLDHHHPTFSSSQREKYLTLYLRYQVLHLVLDLFGIKIINMKLDFERSI
jgi:hypothetical protein